LPVVLPPLPLELPPVLVEPPPPFGGGLSLPPQAMA
jgi:hypothetical protein